MNQRIIVCGGNGAGKSTLGKALAEEACVPFLDIEDYWFPCKNPDYPYAAPAPQAEVKMRLLSDMHTHPRFVFAAVKGTDPEITALLTCAVFLEVPKALRMKRIRERSFRRFGNRILPGGDLYREEEAFFRMAERKSENHVPSWLRTAGLPVIHADGTKPIGENVRYLMEKLNLLP